MSFLFLGFVSICDLWVLVSSIQTIPFMYLVCVYQVF